MLQVSSRWLPPASRACHYQLHKCLKLVEGKNSAQTLFNVGNRPAEVSAMSNISKNLEASLQSFIPSRLNIAGFMFAYPRGSYPGRAWRWRAFNIYQIYALLKAVSS